MECGGNCIEPCDSGKDFDNDTDCNCVCTNTCSGCQTPNASTCVCEDDDSNCASPRTCVSGVCTCPAGTQECSVDGTCVAECTGGKIFNDICVCVCPSGTVECGETCLPPTDGACGDLDANSCTYVGRCGPNEICQNDTCICQLDPSDCGTPSPPTECILGDLWEYYYIVSENCTCQLVGNNTGISCSGD